MRDEVKSLLGTASLALEEARGWIAEDPELGDNGVGELIVNAENILDLAGLRLSEQT